MQRLIEAYFRHNEPGGPPSIELTSDRLSLALDKSTVIQPENLQRLRELRSRGFLHASPKEVIVNEHQEVAVDVTGGEGRPMTLEYLVGILSGLKLSDRTPVKFERPARTLDIYVVENGVSQRMRYYFEDTKLASSRTITVAGDGNGHVNWFQGGRVALARRECVYVEREDVQPGENALAKVKDNTAKFIGRHKGRGVTAVILKNIVRGNFGERTMWSHRRAVLDGNGTGDDPNLFESDAVIGMGPFLNLAVQSIRRIDLPQAVGLEKIAPFMEELSSSGVLPDNIYQIFPHIPIGSAHRIEIECKGDEFEQVQGPYIVHQLVSPGQLLRVNHIGFDIARGRKVATGPLRLIV